MGLIIIFIPLIVAIVSGLCGRLIGIKGVRYLNPIVMGLVVLCSFFLFYKVSICGKIYVYNLGSWIYLDSLDVKWQFAIDNLTVVMMLIVTIVSFAVHLYSTEYMENDPHLPRFMSYLSLFTHFMLILISADNLILMFLGWEGVGLCSYLLISFWYTRIQANKSAIKALVVNRVSDFAFTIGILIVFWTFQSVEFSTIFALTPFFIDQKILFLNCEVKVLELIGFLLFVGAMGKSAQIGLHTWLPDAMEGPTPVSALIHAATMVTAGVFLIIKCSPLFEYIPSILIFITFIGAFTAFFSATVGLVQSDIKKVIAYSTCSQLGYMFFVCGLSGYHIGFFHLVNHAFFKALLFLSAGAIIHSMSNEQDMRKYGALLNLLPFTYIMVLIGSLSLMGFPFLTGYYSKDLILEFAFAKYTISGMVAYWLGLITAFFTAFYSVRILYLTFLTKSNAYKKVIEHVHELPLRMAVALSILAIGSIFLGYLARDLFVGIGNNFWNTSIFILPENNTFVETEFVPLIIRLLPFLMTLFALALVFSAYKITVYTNFLHKIWFTEKFTELHHLLTNKWYFDIVYNRFINFHVLEWSYNITFKLLDKGILELFGPLGLGYLTYTLALKINNFQEGYVYRYAHFTALISLLILLITYYMW